MLGEEIQTYEILYLQPDRVAGGLGERAPCCLSSLWNVSKELHVKQYTWAPKCQAIKILPPPSVPRFQMSAWYPIVSGLCFTFLCHSDQISTMKDVGLSRRHFALKLVYGYPDIPASFVQILFSFCIIFTLFSRNRWLYILLCELLLLKSYFKCYVTVVIYEYNSYILDEM